MSLQQLLPYLIPLAVVALVIKRQLGVQRKRVATLWVMPAVLACAACYGLYKTWQPSAPGAAVLLAGACFGAGVAAMRMRLMKIEALPETGEIVSSGSPLMVVFIVALLALRRFVLPEAMHEAGLVGAQVLDFGLASVLAMLTVRTGLMYRLYGQAVARQQPLPLPEVEAA